MESLKKPYRQGRFANHAIGVAQNSAFYLAKVSHQLRCGPGIGVRLCIPDFERNGIGRA
jgi:hypothetical protein